MLWYNPFRVTDFLCDVMDDCSIILYAIALADQDQDQEQASDARRVLRAKEGFATLALYLASGSRWVCNHPSFAKSFHHYNLTLL
jgi:hypothetical protein